MKKDIVICLLRSHEQELREAGLGGLYLFGSTANGTAGSASDVDLFFDIARPINLFHLAGLKERLENIVGTKVDLMSRQAIHPRRRAPIENCAVRVF